METRFKRSIFGCEPACVEKNIEVINSEFDESFNTIRLELASLAEENQSLRDRISNMKKEIDEVKRMKLQIGWKLLNTHINTCSDLYRAISASRETEKQMTEQIESANKERLILKDNLKKLIAEFQSKVEEYKLGLEANNYDRAANTDKA